MASAISPVPDVGEETLIYELMGDVPAMASDGMGTPIADGAEYIALVG